MLAGKKSPQVSSLSLMDKIRQDLFDIFVFQRHRGRLELSGRDYNRCTDLNKQDLGTEAI